MMSSKIFSQLEYVCRHLPVSGLSKYFGGLQVILAGDFYQLPPVPNELYGDFGKYCVEVNGS